MAGIGVVPAVCAHRNHFPVSDFHHDAIVDFLVSFGLLCGGHFPQVLAGCGNIAGIKMNRRISVLYYWLARKNSVSIGELARFLTNPRMPVIAARYIVRVEADDIYQKVWLKGVADCLFWPKELEWNLLCAMIAELCDPHSWHNYFHPLTPVSAEDVVIDVGAAEGLFALLALRRGARVVAVEPNPVFVASMQRTFQRHAPGRITIFPIAASDREGWASLSPEPLLSTVGAAGAAGGDNVRLLPLDRLLSDLASVTFIKADVEGHEMRMLQGASGLIRRFRPKLAITCYHEENDASEMVRFVRGLVPEYQYALTGITEFHGKPLMARFWVPGTAGTAGGR
jgi:FkbM family methyltransferase